MPVKAVAEANASAQGMVAEKNAYLSHVRALKIVM
jgi:hypothetical protein